MTRGSAEPPAPQIVPSRATSTLTTRQYVRVPELSNSEWSGWTLGVGNGAMANRAKHLVHCTDGETIACWVEGHGRPVVLFHGLACSSGTWGPVAERLVEAGYQVVVVDLRGHGESTIGNGKLTLTQLAEDVGSVLEALDVRDAIVVGHSAGGYHVLAASGDRAFARVRCVVTIGTHGEVRSLRERAVLWFSASRLFYALFSFPSAGRALMRGGAFGLAPDRAVVEQVRLDALSCARAAKRAHVRATAGTSVLAHARALSVPYTAVTGSRDVVATPALIRSLAAAAPQGRAVILERVGPMAIVETPAEVSDLIVAALTNGET